MKQLLLSVITSIFLITHCVLIVSANTTDENNSVSIGDHEYVDLALPSGTLWAKCNIGAKNEKATGFFYSWGEIKPKENNKYTSAFYKYYKARTYLNQIKRKSTEYLLSKYNKNKSFGSVDNKKVLDATDDAAISNWGDYWCMPTEEQLRELTRECKWIQVGTGGKTLYKVVGKNQNYIYIPVGGYLRQSNNYGSSPYYSQSEVKGSYLWDKNDQAYFWSNALCNYPDVLAVAMTVKSSESYIDGVDRTFGANIRPVVSNKGLKEISKANDMIAEKWLTENNGKFNSKDLFPFEMRSYFPRYFGEHVDSITQELFRKMTSRYPNLKYTPAMTMEALELDNPRTQYLFLAGYCHYMGLGVKKNKERSRQFLLEGAMKGDYRCTVMLFALGLAGEKNANDVILLSKAANSGYLPAMVAYTYIKATSQPDRYMDPYKFKFYKKDNLDVLLKYNYPEAFYLYGKILSDNAYIEKAADMGHLYAIKDMVEILDNKQLYGKAYQYLLKGDKLGARFEKQMYVRVKLNGLSFSHNPEDVARALKDAFDMKAYKYVVEAAANATKRNVISPDILALYAMAGSKLIGDDAQKRKELFNLMKNSAEKRSVYGMEGLAEFYEKGYGLNAPDMQNAFVWYKQAAQRGSKKAQNYLKGRNLKW